jgi:pyruvate dehydrogenase E2 component (dihydrolipoamide acetyltransferase)
VSPSSIRVLAKTPSLVASISIAIKPMMNITVTVDHRLIDGLLAAQFVTEVKRLLENPIELLI